MNPPIPGHGPLLRASFRLSSFPNASICSISTRRPAGRMGRPHAVEMRRPRPPSNTPSATLRITAPWMRATPKGASVAGGYLTITNTGKKPDRLLRIESDVATTVEVHEMSMSGEVMRMRPAQETARDRAWGVVELKPSGIISCSRGLRQSMNQGDKVRARMVFREGRERSEIEFSAEGIAATGPRNAEQDAWSKDVGEEHAEKRQDRALGGLRPSARRSARRRRAGADAPRRTAAGPSGERHRRAVQARLVERRRALERRISRASPFSSSSATPIVRTFVRRRLPTSPPGSTRSVLKGRR